MKLELVAAFGSRGEMGFENDLPWRLPSDLKHFKKLTVGSVLIMGRKTFDSLPGMLPGRIHIVLTRTPVSLEKENLFYVNTIEQLESLLSSRFADKTSFVIGGSQIYRSLAPYVHKAHITHVHCSCQADTFFPKDILTAFSKKQEVPVTPSKNDEYSYNIVQYEIE